MDYKKYIGKRAILASRRVRVVGVLNDFGDIDGRIALQDSSYDNLWSLSWFRDHVGACNYSCNVNGFILAIDGVIIYATDSVICREELIKEFDLREPTLYDLL